MRDILKKVTTGSMIAGAALLVAACGGDTAVNNTTIDASNDVMIDANMPMEDLNAVDANATMDANTSMDANATSTDANAADTNAAQ